MVCLGLEPGAAGWKAQTNPLSYGGMTSLIVCRLLNRRKIFSCPFVLFKLFVRRGVRNVENVRTLTTKRHTDEDNDDYKRRLKQIFRIFCICIVCTKGSF